MSDQFPATGFADTCEVAVHNTYATHGTLTRAKLGILSPDQKKALFYGDGTGGYDAQINNGLAGWVDHTALYKHQIEMAACGVRRDNFYDWLMSSSRPGMGQLINVRRSSRGPSLIEPFITAAQTSFWNADHWVVIGNVRAGDYSAPGNGEGSNPGPGITTISSVNNRILTVASSFGGTMHLHPDYFLPGKFIHVMSRAAGGAMRLTQFQIRQAARNTNYTLDVEVTYQQTSSPSIPSNPTGAYGQLFLGINNVHDMEPWAYNFHNVNLNKDVPFWYQTRRKSRTIDSAYEEMFARLMENNAWFTRFGDLPAAERNRQDEHQDRLQFMHAFLFGERISQYQNLDQWKLLGPIKSLTGEYLDPGTGEQFQAFRANMIGVIPQLADCDRVIDNAGDPDGYPIDTFLEQEIYNIVRARRSQNRPADQIDIWTDETTADEFQSAFIEYSKVKTGDIARINLEQGVTEWGFPFRRFKLYKPSGVFVNILTAPFFDDMASAAGQSAYGYGDAPWGSGAAGLGKFLMVLDLGAGGTIYPATLASNRKTYTVGDINDLAKIDATYSQVMDNPKFRRTLTSETTTAIVEAPPNSLVVANFEKLVPTAA